MPAKKRSSTRRSGPPRAAAGSSQPVAAGKRRGSTARPGAAAPSARQTPSDKRRALEVEKEFGKDVRRATERSGRKPATWRASERPESREAVRGTIGAAAVQRATTRTWVEWRATLDAEDMQQRADREIVHHLITSHELTPFWAQMVCVGYRQAQQAEQSKSKPVPVRSARATSEPSRSVPDASASNASAASTSGRTRSEHAPPPHGALEISVARTIDASASDIFRAFNDPTRRQWSGVPDYVVRTAVAPRSLRIGLADGSQVVVSIARKGNRRCAVSLRHTALPDATAAEQARRLWRDALMRLAGVLSE